MVQLDNFRWVKGIILLAGLAAGARAQAQQVQWADKVIDFSSEYHEEKYTREFRATQVLGRPNKLPQVGASYCAWSPATRGDTLEEWVTVGYRTPQRVRQIAVAESLNEGTVAQIWLYDEQDQPHKVYDNQKVDTVAAQGRMLNVLIPMTTYKAKALKLVLNTGRIKGWNHIDAIGISSVDAPVRTDVNLASTLPIDLKRENVGPSINTQAEETSPVISPDGRTLYFTHSPDPLNVGRPDAQDVWYATLQPDKKWGKAVNIGSPINNDDQNSSFSVTPDGNTMLLNNVYLSSGRMKRGLSMTKKTATGWSFPQEVKIANYYNDSDFSEFTLAQNGDVIVMTIQRKDTYGRKDLYVSYRKPDNTWTEPRNLGGAVNSAEDETSPFLASDGKTLYFSSAGFSGYGSNDIFVTKRLDDTWLSWSEPQNLGPQINTPDWDAYFSIPASGEYAYFVSASNSLGEGDIFRARLSGKASPDPVVLLRGNVYRADTKAPIAAEIVYSLAKPAGKPAVRPKNAPARRDPFAASEPGSEAAKTPATEPFATDQVSLGSKAAGHAATNPTTGEYQIVLPLKQQYQLLASAEGFLSATETIDLRKYTDYQELRRDLYLVPIEVGQKVKLTAIAFSQSKYNLLDSSLPELDRLVELMQTNPRMEIQLEGHTDNQGDWNLNIKLSEDRVKEVRRYLVAHGIAEARVQFKAFGSTQPVASNLNENARALNRRVEFVVLKK